MVRAFSKMVSITICIVYVGDKQTMAINMYF
jgi:hypothetical protein